MSDTSLMNPDHLKSELRDLENELIPETEKLAREFHEDYNRIIDYVKDTHNRKESTTLTHEQVADLIRTLAKFDQNTWRFSNSHKFDVRVYKKLMTDRRWIIGSKLRFLKK